MATIASLLPLLRPSVKGVPDFVATEAILRSARDFCRKTWYCRRTIEVALIAGEKYYDLSPESDTEQIIGIKSIQYRDQILAPTSPEEMRTNGEEGDPCAYFVEDSDTVAFYPTPRNTESNVCYARVAVQPSSDAEDLPDDLVVEFEQAIIDGAIMWLTRMEGQAWTNYEVSAKMEALYGQAVHRAKADAMRARQPFNLRIRPKPFAI